MYTIVKDTREKIGSWDFDGQIVRTVKTGDYTIDGMENIICIERKKSISELANNLISKRFYNELRRMDEIKHNFLVLEFSMYDLLYYPQTTNMSYERKKKIQMNGQILLCKLNELMLDYNVQVLFCESRDHAMQVAQSLFKRIDERYGTT